jgi:uncharacterized tellurite resistance protein B-like protein
MINKFQNLLDLISKKENKTKNKLSDLETATCVLFLELAHADFKVAPQEEQMILKNMASFFSLSENDVEELVKLSQEKREQRTDIWFFTDMIKNNFERSDKIKILEMLWALVYADGYMDKYEEALMRKITALLGLAHSEMVGAKLKAKKEVNKS